MGLVAGTGSLWQGPGALRGPMGYQGLLGARDFYRVDEICGDR